MKVIKLELSDDRAFDDLVNLDCVSEVLFEKIQDSDDWEDQRVMRSWKKTVDKLRVAYSDVVMEVENANRNT
jgi:hypothetical protein